jgi:hypothetical protein
MSGRSREMKLHSRLVQAAARMEERNIRRTAKCVGDANTDAKS